MLYIFFSSIITFLIDKQKMYCLYLKKIKKNVKANQIIK
jgi:hypothetical protein